MSMHFKLEDNHKNKVLLRIIGTGIQTKNYYIHRSGLISVWKKDKYITKKPKELEIRYKEVWVNLEHFRKQSVSLLQNFI